MYKAEFHDAQLLNVLHVQYRELYGKIVDRYVAEYLKEHENGPFVRMSVEQAVDNQIVALTKDYYYKISQDNYPEYSKILGCDYIQRRLKVMAKESSGGCYVATAVYGSYDCPQVWTLRRYRDDTLAKTWYGRVFIKIYYSISPTLVKWFGHTKWFKNMWKGKLDRMVSDLQAKGVESTPYEDRNW